MSKKKKREKEEEPFLPPLPPSGLAEDVLQFLDMDEAEPQARETPALEPERIYNFADSLNAMEEESPEAQVKFEKWVLFVLEGESFGLPVSHVREVLRVSDITRVPHAPQPVRGIINMRGHLLPVVDTRRRIGLEEGGLTHQSRILVAETRGRLIGLLVDAVHNVFPLDPGRIEPPPPDVMTVKSDYLLGVYHHDDRLLILLDPEKVFLIQGELN